MSPPLSAVFLVFLALKWITNPTMKGSATPVSTRQEEAVYYHLTHTSQARPRWVRLPSHATLSYPPGHQTIATAPSCSSFSSPWDRWCLKRFSAAKSQWCVKLNHGQRKYDRLQWISGRYNHLQTPRNICSLEPPFHPLSNVSMLAYIRYNLTIKLVGNKLVRKPKNFAPF